MRKESTKWPRSRMPGLEGIRRQFAQDLVRQRQEQALQQDSAQRELAEVGTAGELVWKLRVGVLCLNTSLRLPLTVSQTTWFFHSHMFAGL